MGQLDASIVTLALPRLGQDLHASIGAVQWVLLVYLLVLMCTLTAVGHLADMIGRKLLYVYGFGVFTAGSTLCGLAPSLWWLIGARILQGIGAAMLQANSVALIRDALPEQLLGRGIGIQGTAQALGLAMGPAVGGALLALGGWRLLFFVNVPAGAIGMALGWFLLPRTRNKRQRERFDGPGAIWLALTAGGLMLVLSLARQLGPTSPALDAMLIVTVASAGGFVRRERRARVPLVELPLFCRRALSIGLSSGLVSYFVMFGTLFVVPYYLAARHLGSTRSGLELAALPIALAIVAPFAGRMMDRAGSRALTVSGMLVTGVGLIELALRHDGPGRMVGLTIAGVGLGVFTPANNAAIMASAPRKRAGVVSGVLNMTRGLGTALGVAVTSLIYTSAASLSGPGQRSSEAAASHGMTIALFVLAAAAFLNGVTLWSHRSIDYTQTLDDYDAVVSVGDAYDTASVS
jgi:EmrB/QacA subfamily drug resistance transporter